jgi:hypothetical protein
VAIARPCSLLACGCAWALAAVAHAATTPAPPAASQTVIERTNALRARHGLATVTPDAALERTAADFAGYMARTGRYGHEADGHTPDERARTHGYDACLVDENIGWVERSPAPAATALGDAFYAGWEASPPHRRNMLDPDVTQIGLGMARAASGRWYAVELLGRPASAMLEFSITDAGAGSVHYRIGERDYALEPRATRTHRLCRPGRLTVEHGVGKAAEGVMPKGGDRFALVPTPGGRWQLEPAR